MRSCKRRGLDQQLGLGGELLVQWVIRDKPANGYNLTFRACLFPDVLCVTREVIAPNGVGCGNHTVLAYWCWKRKGPIMKLLQYALTRPVITNALKVALVVGLCLNAINQGSQLWHGVGIDWPRVGMNFLVPYLVASYSAARMFMKASPD